MMWTDTGLLMVGYVVCWVSSDFAFPLLTCSDIWDSITVDADDVTISDAQKQELERRLELYYQNPHQVSSWEEVKQKFNR